ncbi:hypothetical protein MP638_006815 [Amoeboaphelidium occidentale]|nr:hypothetical protein MP638_006815 [Amoeboaphelidium occidentale]
MKSFDLIFASALVGCAFAESFYVALFKGEPERVNKVSDTTFERYDVDKSGALSQEELKNVFASITNAGFVGSINEEAHKESFKRADENMNGEISKEELRAYMVAQFSSTDKKDFQNAANLEGANLNEEKVKENAMKLLNEAYKKQCGENVAKKDYETILKDFINCTEKKDADTCAKELCDVKSEADAKDNGEDHDHSVGEHDHDHDKDDQDHDHGHDEEEHDDDEKSASTTALVKRDGATQEELAESVDRLHSYNIAMAIIAIVQIAVIMLFWSVISVYSLIVLLIPTIVVLILYIIEFVRYTRLRRELREPTSDD